MRVGLLAGRYPAAAGMAICALVPYLALSAALQPLSPIIAGDLGMSAQTMSMGVYLAVPALWAVWGPGRWDERSLSTAVIGASGYWITQLSAALYPGTALFDHARKPRALLAPRYTLKLYVTGQTPRSLRSVENHLSEA